MKDTFTTGAQRGKSEGRGLPHCISPHFIDAVAKRAEEGAEIYGKDNWMQGIPASRFIDALQRHLNGFAKGHDDEDHVGAIGWNAMALLDTMRRIKGGELPSELDDRPFKARPTKMDENPFSDTSIYKPASEDIERVPEPLRGFLKDKGVLHEFVIRAAVSGEEFDGLDFGLQKDDWISEAFPWPFADQSSTWMGIDIAWRRFLADTEAP